MRAAGLCLVLFAGSAVAAPPETGPETEKRFPQLVVPEGFKATLFACDPLVEYPSGIAAGPKAGTAFVAIDYMTGLGTEIVRRSEVRLVQDTDGDGYADEAPVFADGFNSIEGITWHEGVVYVMHAPFLTAVYDRDRDGKPEDRKDLLRGLGLTPEDNPVRLHCANGIVAGHDGWLYLALGDHGCDVPRPEGDRLVFNGGGILRCRPDGRDLHVFASGLRNIYDVALDAELNVFVRDNENDGGDYKIRVCHSLFGADHGYPYNYYERPDEALPPLADLGLGSSAGGVCYLESQFPAEYRGNLFFCEWGKSLVRYRPERDKSSTFAPLKEIEFATGAANDPNGFKPTDVVVQRDGSLLVADYCDGQRPKRGRGRVYCVRYVGDGASSAPPSIDPDVLARKSLPELIDLLNSESYWVRCETQAAIERREEAAAPSLLALLGGPGGENERARLHAIWALVHIRGEQAIDDLLRIGGSDPAPAVRVQAIRAVADLADPVLASHDLDASAGDAALAARLAEIGKRADRPVQLEIIVALGRLRWPGTAHWLREHVKEFDPPLAHAAMMAMRRSGNWPAVLKLIDAPSSDPLRPIALRAAAEQFDLELVDGLIQRLFGDNDPTRTREYADLLTRVYRKPGPWVYWNYRPAPRSPNTETWERTQQIGESLDTALANPDLPTRLAILQRMQREQIPMSTPALGNWLKEERDPKRVAAILVSLGEQPAGLTRDYLLAAAREPKHGAENRLMALKLFLKGLNESSASRLLTAIEGLEDGPLLAEAVRAAGQFPKLQLAPVLVKKVESALPEVRAAAIAALGELRAPEASRPLHKLLGDETPAVRAAAAQAAGQLADADSIAPLLQLAADREPAVRRASLSSLRLMKEPRAVPLATAALADIGTSATALECLAELGGPGEAAAVTEFAKGNPSPEAIAAAIRTLSAWRERAALPQQQKEQMELAIATIQGTSGVLSRWSVVGPVAAKLPAGDVPVVEPQVRTLYATGVEARVALAPKDSPKDVVWTASTVLAVPEPVEIELLASSSGSLEVLLNSKSIYQRTENRTFRADSDRASATLAAGINHLSVKVGSSAEPVEFHLRFRRKSATAEHERLVQAAISRAGNPERGRAVMLNIEKSQCLKCHRVGDQGERTGPELTGLGSRFSRIHIAESILEPSRSISPSFGTLSLLLTDGRPLSGVKIAETDATLTLVDNQAQKHTINKADIDQQKPSTLSTMPEGLEKKLSEEEFVDLVALLASLKESASP
jgi:putative membrane-bound dehydrogenase-like protein